MSYSVSWRVAKLTAALLAALQAAPALLTQDAQAEERVRVAEQVMLSYRANGFPNLRCMTAADKAELQRELDDYFELREQRQALGRDRFRIGRRRLTFPTPEESARIELELENLAEREKSITR